jgi:hypothetical protein
VLDVSLFLTKLVDKFLCHGIKALCTFYFTWNLVSNSTKFFLENMKTIPTLDAAVYIDTVQFYYNHEKVTFEQVAKLGVDPQKYAKWLIQNRKPFGANEDGAPIYRTTL